MAEKRSILTKEGYKKLQDELKHLETVGRKEIADKLNEAKSYGDLSENAAYSVALEQRDLNEIKIAELQDLLAKAEIVEEQESTNSKKISIGSIVVLEEPSGEKMEFEVVGAGETDLIAKKFDINSPLVQALVGKKVNDKVKVKLPGGEKDYKVVSISH